MNFDFFTWNLQWQPFSATLTPSALPPAAQDRLNLLLGKNADIMLHAAAVIAEGLNRAAVLGSGGQGWDGHFFAKSG